MPSPARHLITGLTWTLLSQVVVAVLQFGYAAVTSRHVGAAGFGDYAVALMVVGFGALVADLGLTNAAARMEVADRAQVRSIVTLAAVSGGVLGAVAFFGAPVWAGLWGRPTATGPLQIMAIGLMVSPTVGVLSSVLRRQGRIRAFAAAALLMNPLAMLVGAAVVIMHPTSTSLAVMPTLAGLLTLSLRVWQLRGWAIPGRWNRRSGAEIRFGLRSTGNSFMAYISIALPQLALSRGFPADTLGFWNRASVVTTVPAGMAQSSVQAVIYPSFRDHASDPPTTRIIWSRFAVGLSILVWPVVGVLVPSMGVITRVLFGAGWDQSAQMAQWMIASAGVAFVYTLLSAGQESAGLFRQVYPLTSILVVGSTASALLAVASGSWVAVAAGLLLTYVVAHAVQLVRAGRSGFVDLAYILRRYVLVLLASVTIGGFTWGLLRLSSGIGLELVFVVMLLLLTACVSLFTVWRSADLRAVVGMLSHRDDPSGF